MKFFSAMGASPLVLCIAALAALALRFLVIPDVGTESEASPSSQREASLSLPQLKELLRDLLTGARDKFDSVSPSSGEGAMFDVECRWLHDGGALWTRKDAAFADVVLSMVRRHLVPDGRVQIRSREGGGRLRGNAGSARPLIRIDATSSGGNHSLRLNFYPPGSEEVAWVSVMTWSQ